MVPKFLQMNRIPSECNRALPAALLFLRSWKIPLTKKRRNSLRNLSRTLTSSRATDSRKRRSVCSKRFSAAPRATRRLSKSFSISFWAREMTAARPNSPPSLSRFTKNAAKRPVPSASANFAAVSSALRAFPTKNSWLRRPPHKSPLLHPLRKKLSTFRLREPSRSPLPPPPPKRKLISPTNGPPCLRRRLPLQARPLCQKRPRRLRPKSPRNLKFRSKSKRQLPLPRWKSFPRNLQRLRPNALPNPKMSQSPCLSTRHPRRLFLRLPRLRRLRLHRRSPNPNSNWSRTTNSSSLPNRSSPPTSKNRTHPHARPNAQNPPPPPPAPKPPAAAPLPANHFLADMVSEPDAMALDKLGPAVPQASARPPAPVPPAPPVQPLPQQKAAAAPPAPAAPVEAGPLQEVFDEFRAEIGEMGGEEEDLETHYNLGIAFREMGLLEEAISEFQKVAKATDKGKAFRYAMQCCTLLGLAFMEKGQPNIAAIWYERALHTPGVDAESTLALRYDLGVAQESAGDIEAALKSFSQVYAANIDYRDVADRIASLQKPAR